MSVNLPEPTKFKNFTPAVKIQTYKSSDYNLSEEIKKFNLSDTKTIIYFELLEMFGFGFIGSLNFTSNETLKNIESEIIKLKSFFYDYKTSYGHIKTFSTLAILLYDTSGELKTAAFRRYRNKKGEIIKWFKVRGSESRFIPYRLRDGYNHCFVAFGMSEALIFNALGLDYFILQSDSIALNIENNPYFQAIKEKLKGRDILILPDYDKSGFKASEALYSTLKAFSKPEIIEYYKSVDDPPSGYDFRDYVLSIQNKDRIIENLLTLI